MPLAQKPHRPKPEVELVSSRRVSIEAVLDLLQRALRPKKPDGTLAKEEAKDFVEVPGSDIIKFRTVPEIVRVLQDDWVTWPKEQRLPRSCFVEVTGRLETHLHPVFLSQLGLGLRGAAGFLLHRWVDALGCVPLGFLELKPASTYAAVVAESPYIHFLVDFRAVGFAPRKGDWLVGRPAAVQAKAGLNVTILGLLNSRVTQRRLPPELQDNPRKSLGLGEEEHEASEKADKKDARPAKVWLKLVEDPFVDKFNKHGSLVPDLMCELGWPPEEVPAQLEQARADLASGSATSSAQGRKRPAAGAEAEEVNGAAASSAVSSRGRGSGAAGRGAGSGRGRGHSVQSSDGAVEQAEVKKKKKRDSGAVEAEEEFSPAVAKKRKKRDSNATEDALEGLSPAEGKSAKKQKKRDAAALEEAVSPAAKKQKKQDSTAAEEGLSTSDGKSAKREKKKKRGEDPSQLPEQYDDS